MVYNFKSAWFHSNASKHGQLQLTGWHLGRVFNFRFGNLQAEHFGCYQLKLPNLKLKTQPKQLLGSLPSVIALPNQSYAQISYPAGSAGQGISIREIWWLDGAISPPKYVIIWVRRTWKFDKLCPPPQKKKKKNSPFSAITRKFSRYLSAFSQNFSRISFLKHIFFLENLDSQNILKKNYLKN